MFKRKIIQAIKDNGESVESVAIRIGYTKQGLYRRLTYPHLMPINKLLLISDAVKIDTMTLIKLIQRTKK